MESVDGDHGSSSDQDQEVDNTHQSDDSSGDFRVLNISKAIRESGQSVNDCSSEDRLRCSSSSKNDSQEQKSDDRNDSRSVLIGGPKLAGWISSVRKASLQAQNTPSFTKMIRKNKNFHNPAIFAKMISYCSIDEFGTRFKTRKALKKGDFYTDIADVQDFCMKGLK